VKHRLPLAEAARVSSMHSAQNRPLTDGQFGDTLQLSGNRVRESAPEC